MSAECPDAAWCSCGSCLSGWQPPLARSALVRRTTSFSSAVPTVPGVLVGTGCGACVAVRGGVGAGGGGVVVVRVGTGWGRFVAVTVGWGLLVAVVVGVGRGRLLAVTVGAGCGRLVEVAVGAGAGRSHFFTRRARDLPVLPR